MVWCSGEVVVWCGEVECSGGWMVHWWCDGMHWWLDGAVWNAVGRSMISIFGGDWMRMVVDG